MSPPIDLTGQVFGDLTVIRRADNTNDGKARWHCSCACGGSTTSVGTDLRIGKATSCGCKAARISRTRLTTHGQSGTAQYSAWCAMIRRCENPADPKFEDYGGRGIHVHPSWRHNFAIFLRDVGERPGPEYSLDRIDNDGNYEPGNVRWATHQQQANNRRPRRWRKRDPR